MTCEPVMSLYIIFSFSPLSFVSFESIAFPTCFPRMRIYSTYVWVARVYACKRVKRVHTLPAAFFEPNFSCFCEDTTEGRVATPEMLLY